ncbi:MAG: trypsin-like peptidase domain-containing protein [Thaumarchaeota archaeon]|nr:trypsin-like peptidase domain-containing protein [Nitrososphaerota archaeon]
MTLASFEKEITEAVEKLSESVVTIDSMRLARDFRYGLVPLEGLGSGVIISEDGYIVTNNHVIDGAAKVQVNLKDGRSFTGEVIGGDSATDIAVLKVNANNLPAAKLGESEKLKVGQIALAIGNTLGLPGGPTVSLGVISALGRPLPGADYIYEGLLQTDAAINPGNSGGPLADLNGNVIGINTAMIPFAQGVGFAIPIDTVKRITEQLFQNGKVVRPWLGISGVNLSPEITRRYDLPTEEGVFIVEVASRSPAYEAGIRIGDVIVQIGSHEIKQMKDLIAALSKIPLNEAAPVSVIRMGVKYQTNIRPVEAPHLMRRRN